MNSTTPENNETDDPSGELSVRFVRQSDVKYISELFRKVFGEEMTQAHWHWKYDRSQSRAVVVYRGDRLVAHYGGVGTDILLEGKASTAIQITDLMVDPDARHAVRSKSPFYLSAKKFLENYVGYDNPFLLGYGFPSERAMGLSETLGFFAPAGKMWECEWPAGRKSFSFADRLIALDADNFPGYEEKINQLWLQFSKQFANHIVCRKDAGYFKWRYLDHPSKNYSLYLVQGRLTGQPRALLVMRFEQHDSIGNGARRERRRNDKVMLMDFLGDTGDLAGAIDHARNITASKGGIRLQTWCSDTFCGVFSLKGARQKALPIVIPACTGSPGPAPQTQENKWWFMPGDTDYL